MTEKEFNALVPMLHADFIDGREFYYKGDMVTCRDGKKHYTGFMRLERHPLYYDLALNRVIDRTLQARPSNDECPEFNVLDIAPEGFLLYHKCFGKIIIYYTQCRLKEPVTANA